MKTKNLILNFIIIIAILLISACSKSEKPAYISKEYEIYGTWINPEYNNTGSFAKVVLHPNGKAELYNVDNDTRISLYAEFVITNKWTDSDGNIWYTLIGKVGKKEDWFYELNKISNSGKTLENALSLDDYPQVIDQKDPRYSYQIRYRQ